MEDTFFKRLRYSTQKDRAGAPIQETGEAMTTALTCPSCGAGRVKADGITVCAYCGYRFITVALSEGLHLGEADNSKTG